MKVAELGMSCHDPGPISVRKFPIKFSKSTSWTSLPGSWVSWLLQHLGATWHTQPFHRTAHNAYFC